LPGFLPLLDLGFVFYADFVGGFLNPRFHARCPSCDDLQFFVGIFVSLADSVY
jgi:hypothetical protein